MIELRPRAAMASDVGRVRQTNEDACLLDYTRGLFVLTDGMGGHRGGAVAAQLIISALPDLLDRELACTADAKAGTERDALRRAVVALSADVWRLGSEKEDLLGMGATLVVALIARGTAHIVHLGDSRAYLIRQSELIRLTVDHNLAELLVQTGRLPAAEAANHPGRHRLTRHMGMQGEADPEVCSVSLQHADRLVLCSDGLTGMLRDDQVLAVLARVLDPDDACSRLIAAANAAGGRDNITVIVIDV